MVCLLRSFWIKNKSTHTENHSPRRMHISVLHTHYLCVPHQKYAQIHSRICDGKHFPQHTLTLLAHMYSRIPRKPAKRFSLAKSLARQPSSREGVVQRGLRIYLCFFFVEYFYRYEKPRGRGFCCCWFPAASEDGFWGLIRYHIWHILQVIKWLIISTWN